MLTEGEEQRVVRAIANAERGNRGEVRVHLERRCPVKEPYARARELYRELGMHRTKDDTAVLLYVATDSRKAAVHCGAGVHPHADDTFWQSVTDAVAKGFSEHEPAAGLCAALNEIGEVLRRHVPGEDTAGNELPDAVTVGDREADAEPPEVVDEVASDALSCVSCGAAVSFDREGETSPMKAAACKYCGVVNDRALAMFRKQLARERHAELLRLERIRRRNRILAGSAAALATLLIAILFAIHAHLGSLRAEVDRSRAQVRNVRERQVAVRAQWATAPPSSDRDAELSGAENRVRIERKRYDEAAAAYNAAAGSGFTGLCARWFGMPAHVSLSDEVDW
jgi:uncharacterized membrane protein YgcG